MKNILTLLFCLCTIFSSLGFAENSKSQLAKNEFNFISSNAVAKNEFPNIFRPIGNWFKRLFGKKRKFVEGGPANVISVTLSQTEIVVGCSTDSNSCSDNKTLDVSTAAIDPEMDALIYKYKVSGGKIVGEGSKVVWDLSDVKAGTYTIVAGVDDGCGVCGLTITKEVKVIECPNCN